MADIILKDRYGNNMSFESVPAVKIPTADGGTQIYSKGELVDGVSVDLDFTNGDMTVTAGEGKLFDTVTIKKPSQLVENNIAEGVEIAGIIGTCKGGSGDFDFDDENLKYFTYNIDIENKVIMLYSVLYDVIYANTGSYDVNIPNKMGNYDVVMVSEG